MKNIYDAVCLIYQLNSTNFDEIFDDFQKFSKQNFTEDIKSNWKYIGLNNKDFLFSDYLIQNGFKNLPMVYEEMKKTINNCCESCGTIGSIRYDKHQISVDAKTQPYFDLTFDFCEECGHHFNYDID